MAAMKNITLEIDAANGILDMLLVGLSAYGEIERLDDAFARQGDGPNKPHDSLRPICPTDDARTVGRFATEICTLRNALIAAGAAS